MIKNYIIEQMQNPKVGALVAVTTAGNGVMTSILDIIPDNIMKLSTLVGVLVGFVVMWCHIADQARKRKMARLEHEQVRLDNEQKALENEILRRKLKALNNDTTL